MKKRLIEQMLVLLPLEQKENLLAITEKINYAGHECYIIGGSVRDLVRGHIPHEYDLATSATPEEIKSIFSRVIETGIQHGTVTVRWKGESYEVTTYRIDLDYVDGRRPENVEFGVSLSEDLRRRDFTMNALALDIKKQELIDEHGGLSDIENRIIRTIGDPLQRFSEDGLRPVRAIRFMSTLGFIIEETTYQAIWETRNVTAKVSIERFHDELNKILVSENPYIGLHHLFRNKIFRLFITEPFDPPDNENELFRIDTISSNIPGARIAYWLYIILKHQEQSAVEAEVILKKLKFSRHNIKDTLLFLNLLFTIPEIELLDEYGIRKYILAEIQVFSEKDTKKIEYILEEFFSMIHAVFPDDGNELIVKIKNAFQDAPCLSISQLAVNGGIILQKFPNIDRVLIGKVLADLLDLVLKNPENNREAFLLDRIGEMVIK